MNNKLSKVLELYKLLSNRLKKYFNNCTLFQILRNTMQDKPLLLSFFQQIGLTLNFHRAIKEPKLYAEYSNILKQMPTFGFQAFASVQIEDDLNYVYNEPLLHNKKVSLKNYIAYFRI